MIFVITFFLTALSLTGCICIKKPEIKIILGTLCVFGLLLTMLTGSLTYVIRYRTNDVDSSISPDGQYELLLQQIGDPDWPFGYTHARLVLKNDFRTIVKHRFDVANDGGAVQSDSWKVTWKDTCVEAVISGEE